MKIHHPVTAWSSQIIRLSLFLAVICFTLPQGARAQLRDVPMNVRATDFWAKAVRAAELVKASFFPTPRLVDQVYHHHITYGNKQEAAIVAEDYNYGSGWCTVAIRGTYQDADKDLWAVVQDSVTNLKTGFSDVGGCQVGKTFGDAYNDLKGEGLVKKTIECMDNCPYGIGKCDLVLAGHSKGGGTAMALAVALHKSKGYDATVYTFGSPPAMVNDICRTSSGADIFERNIKVYRFVNSGDCVPDWTMQGHDKTVKFAYHVGTLLEYHGDPNKVVYLPDSKVPMKTSYFNPIAGAANEHIMKTYWSMMKKYSKRINDNCGVPLQYFHVNQQDNGNSCTISTDCKSNLCVKDALFGVCGEKGLENWVKEILGLP